MDAVLAGEEAGLTVKEQTVLLVFLDHCFNSLVCTTIAFSTCFNLLGKQILLYIIYLHLSVYIYMCVCVVGGGASV